MTKPTSPYDLGGGFLDEDGDGSAWLYEHSPEIQAISGVHDWLGRSFGPPMELNSAANPVGLEGLQAGYTLSSLPYVGTVINTVLMDRGFWTFEIIGRATGSLNYWDPQNTPSLAPAISFWGSLR